MQNSINGTQDSYLLASQSDMNYVLLWRDCADVVKVKNFKIEGVAWITQVGPT